MTRSLVIGANGFLGSRLVRTLRDAGHDVTAFDRFRSRPPAFSPEGVRILTGDIRDAEAIRGAVADNELVFHFAGSTDPRSSADDPARELRETIGPALGILDACTAAGVGRVIFASTGGAVYGRQPQEVISETATPAPQSPYAIGKLAVEHYLRFYRMAHGLDSVSLRFANPYGPGQHPEKQQGFIPIAMRAARDRRPVRIFGDGRMVRDYLYIDDAIDLARRLAERPDLAHSEYNIGSGEGHSVTEVLAAIENEAGVAIDRTVEAVPPGFVDRVVLDTSRLRTELGSIHMMPLTVGIARTWAEIGND